MEEDNQNILPSGYMLNEFEILEILGIGGFGITYKALDRNKSKIVAIKEFLPTQIAMRNTQNLSVIPHADNQKNNFDEGLKRFIDEANLLTQFNHINIVKVTQSFKKNNTAYFVMDFVEGESLAGYLSLRENKVFTEDEILSIIMPILEGLKVVHSKGFLHRDIAPDNIYLRKDSLPLLIDFGAARQAVGELSHSISAIAKQGYSPPEQYTSNRNQTNSTDLYAISAVMYRLLTGKKPPESTHRQTALLNDENDPIENIMDKYKNRYSENLLKTTTLGLNIKPKNRIQTIEEYQNMLVDNLKEIPQNIFNREEEKKNPIYIYVIIILFIIFGTVAILFDKLNITDFLSLSKNKDNNSTLNIKKNIVENEKKLTQEKQNEKEIIKDTEEKKLAQKEIKKREDKLIEQKAEQEQLEKVKKEKEQKAEQERLEKAKKEKERKAKQERLEKAKKKREERARKKRLEKARKEKLIQEEARQKQLEKEKEEKRKKLILNQITKIKGVTYQNHKFKKQYNWNSAKKYCDNLKLANYKWRLPTRRELNNISNIKLYGIVNKNWQKWFDEHSHKRVRNSSGYKSFIKNKFSKNMPKNSFFWTNEVQGESAWLINFRYGAEGLKPKSHKNYCLCVGRIQ